jgi:hypothetical protein
LVWPAPQYVPQQICEAAKRPNRAATTDTARAARDRDSGARPGAAQVPPRTRRRLQQRRRRKLAPLYAKCCNLFTKFQSRRDLTTLTRRNRLAAARWTDATTKLAPISMKNTPIDSRCCNLCVNFQSRHDLKHSLRRSTSAVDLTDQLSFLRFRNRMHQTTRNAAIH